MRRTVVIDDGQPDSGELGVRLVGLRDRRFLYAVVVDGNKNGSVQQVRLDREDTGMDGESNASCDCGAPERCRHVIAVRDAASRMLDTGGAIPDEYPGRFVDSAHTRASVTDSGAAQLPTPEELVHNVLGTADVVQLQHLIRRLVRESSEAFRIVHEVALESTTSGVGDRIGTFRAHVDHALGAPGMLEGTDVYMVAQELSDALEWAHQLLPQDAGALEPELRRVLELLRLRILHADDPGGELEGVADQAVGLFRLATRYSCVSRESRQELARWIVEFSSRPTTGSPAIPLRDFSGALGAEGKKACDALLDQWEQTVGRGASDVAAKLDKALAEADEQLDLDRETYESFGYDPYDSAWRPTGWSVEPTSARLRRMRTELRQA